MIPNTFLGKIYQQATTTKSLVNYSKKTCLSNDYLYGSFLFNHTLPTYTFTYHNNIMLNYYNCIEPLIKKISLRLD